MPDSSLTHLPLANAFASTDLLYGTQGGLSRAIPGSVIGASFSGLIVFPVTSVAGRTGAIVLSSSDLTDVANLIKVGTAAGGDLTGTYPNPTIGNVNFVKSVVNDTNVTGSIAANTLTLGWTGTLAAGRLNSNVVQGVTNDTNVTGSISAQNLTLGWSGTLAAGRLNANVVQSVVNDTNVTGSISAQALTLGWTGNLSVARGGSGTGTFTTNGVLYGNGTSAIQATAQGAANTVLTANAGSPSFSASPTIGTSVTTPLIIGGTTASSSLTLESTSGAGTTDSIVFKTASQSIRATMLSNGFLGLGTETNPQAPLVISANAATGLPAVAAVTHLMIQAQDHTDPYLQIDGFGGGGGNHAAGAIVFRTTGGTGAAPNTSVVSNTPVGGIGVRVNAGAGYSSTNTSRINWTYTDTNAGQFGTRMEFDTTPNNSQTRATSMWIQPSGGVSIGPVSIDPGISCLQITANTATTLPALIAGTAFAVAGADGTNPLYVTDAFGNGINAAGSVIFRASRGTGASPNTSLISGDIIGGFGVRPNTGAGYASTNTARINFIYTDTNAGQNGTAIQFDTTPNNSTTRASACRVQPSGGFSVGTTTDPGLGCISASNFFTSGGYTRVTSDFGVTSSTTLTNITGLSVTVVAGLTYSFQVYTTWTNAAAGGLKLAIGGTCTATAIIYDGFALDSGTLRTAGFQSALGGAIVNAGTTTGNQGYATISGTITVNAGGTLTAQIAQGTSNATATTAKQGSWFKVWQVA